MPFKYDSRFEPLMRAGERAEMCLLTGVNNGTKSALKATRLRQTRRRNVRNLKLKCSLCLSTNLNNSKHKMLLKKPRKMDHKMLILENIFTENTYDTLYAALIFYRRYFYVTFFLRLLFAGSQWSSLVQTANLRLLHSDIFINFMYFPHCVKY